MKKYLVLALLTLAPFAQAQFSLTEDFATDPFTRWSFGEGTNGGRFVWNAASPAAYLNDPVGALQVHLDSSLPTARLDRPLGVTLSGGTDFTIRTRFSFAVTSAPGGQSAQIAFGLVNSALTGGDRTGSFADSGSDNVFHTVEFNYFPNVSHFDPDFYDSGPTLSPAVFGAQVDDEDAFANFASIFGPGSELRDNTAPAITALPSSTTLEASLLYLGATQQLSLTIDRVNVDGSLTRLETELPALDLTTAPYYDPSFPFFVDTLAIMAYQDGFTSPTNPSLVADVTFQNLSVSSTVPEPSMAGLLLASAFLAAARMRRRPTHQPVV